MSLEVHTIDEAIMAYLLTGDPVPSDATRLQALQSLQTRLGNAVYFARLPECHGRYALTYQLIASDPDYGLSNEDHIATSVFEMNLWVPDTEPHAAQRASELSEWLRIALTNYRGMMGEVMIYHAQLLTRSSYAREEADMGGWRFTQSQDWSFMHDQMIPGDI